LSQNIKFYVARGEGLSTPPIQIEWSYQGSPIFEVFLYLCLYRLIQNDQIWHGNRYGEGRVLRTATLLHLHKCIARFFNVYKVGVWGSNRTLGYTQPDMGSGPVG